MSTCYDMPYSALHGALSSNSRERVRISSVRLACSQVGTQITGILGIPLILYFSNAGGERTERGYMIAVALICLATMPLSLWTAFKTRERVQPPPQSEKDSSAQPNANTAEESAHYDYQPRHDDLWLYRLWPQQHDDLLLHLRNW